MGRGTTLFLRIAVFLIGMTVLVLCIFWLPWMADTTAEGFPAFAYLKYPVLIGVYTTVIPFYFALYQALKLLNYVGRSQAFSELSVEALKWIKYCAVTISLLYAAGSIYLFSQNALHPGIALIGFAVIFTSIVIAVFTAVLQKLLKSALDIKWENDLTV
ncbi:DUF2975 domain-containing protein [Salibacterium lacus]|uniref:DUF2975 domain-containing protein n=1 Tax=Salibacterium lacus TaxID=1898109 RepID=A0ABW5T578_9BACI